MNSAVWSIAPVLAAQVFVAAAFFLPAPDGGTPAVPAIAAASATPDIRPVERLPEARSIEPLETPPPAEALPPAPVTRAAAAPRERTIHADSTRPAFNRTDHPAPAEIAATDLAAPEIEAADLAAPEIEAADLAAPEIEAAGPATPAPARARAPATMPADPARTASAWTPPGGAAVHPPTVMARRPAVAAGGTLVASGRIELSDEAPDTPRALPAAPPAPTGNPVAAPPPVTVAEAPRGPAPDIRLATGWLARARRHTETVMPGDSLWRIAGRRYGEGLAWPGLWRANRERITDPDLIYPGQVLLLP